MAIVETDIGLDGCRCAPGRVYASNLTIGLLRISGEVDDHGEAVRHKSPSDGGTDATGCACNDRGLSIGEFIVVS